METTKTDDNQHFRLIYLVLLATVSVAAVAAKHTVTTFLASLGATAAASAMASIEVKLSDIPEGQSVTFKWRGKPLFIRHRTASEIKAEQSVQVGELRDPQSDQVRNQIDIILDLVI